MNFFSPIYTRVIHRHRYRQWQVHWSVQSSKPFLLFDQLKIRNENSTMKLRQLTCGVFTIHWTFSFSFRIECQVEELLSNMTTMIDEKVKRRKIDESFDDWNSFSSTEEKRDFYFLFLVWFVNENNADRTHLNKTNGSVRLEWRTSLNYDRLALKPLRNWIMKIRMKNRKKKNFTLKI